MERLKFLAIGVLVLGLCFWDRQGTGRRRDDQRADDLWRRTVAPSDADGLVNGVFTVNGNLTIQTGGSITCLDTGANGNSACPITIVVTGNMDMQAGSAILAENQTDGGAGADIKITVGGNLTMEGGNPGAKISSSKLCPPNQPCGEADGGDILIKVGGVTTTPDPLGATYPAIGQCGATTVFGVPIPANTGDVLIGAGATIISNSAASRAGDIAVYAGKDITVNGTVEARGFTTGGHGGAITLDACCTLLIGDTGFVTAGAGSGAGPGTRGRLHGDDLWSRPVLRASPSGPRPLCVPPERPGKETNSTACVEIWSGTTLTIDSTGTHFGQVNADTATSGGITGLGWIDLLARWRHHDQ